MLFEKGGLAFDSDSDSIMCHCVYSEFIFLMLQQDVWQYFAVTNHAEIKKGGAKNAVCMFQMLHFLRNSTYLRASCLVPNKAGIHQCILINKNDDDMRSALKNESKIVGGILREKEI